MSDNDYTLREAGEDYLEAILNLEGESGEVRSVDVANYLGVSRPSVNKAVGILKDLEMVDQEPYGPIILTDRGREEAKEVARRHRVLRKFLIEVLGVDGEIADEDACKMEHVISQQTADKLIEYLDVTLGDDN